MAMSWPISTCWTYTVLSRMEDVTKLNLKSQIALGGWLTVEGLLHMRVPLNEENVFKTYTPLSELLRNHCPDLSLLLLENYSVDVTARNNQALCVAIQHNLYFLARKLVAMGASPVNADGQMDLACPLAFAALKADRRIIDWLIQLGADVNEFPGQVLFALCYGRSTWKYKAPQAERLDLLRYFLDSGATLAQPYFMATVRSAARRLDLLQCLFEHPTVTVTREMANMTVLVACASHQLDQIRYLVDKHKADVNYVFRDSGTPAATPLSLSTIKAEGAMDVIRLLLDYGADLHAHENIFLFRTLVWIPVHWDTSFWYQDVRYHSRPILANGFGGRSVVVLFGGQA
ncbi:hypothetical protein BC832DRAFT_356522 [Gaertneriomyces semiglobifer]|nr:hypothetical protein BC832DRAFT_356522 [Gaertneriomyces semiglobifer]